MAHNTLKVRFCPATNVLTVEGETLQKFEQVITFGHWYSICDTEGEFQFEVQWIDEGGGNSVFNVEGIPADDAYEGYDIDDYIDYQDIEVVDESGNATGSLKSI